MSRRLTARTLAEWRAAKLGEQGGRCAFCGETIPKGEAVADHDHKTGRMRGVLHRGCNAALGHIENNAPRYKLTNVRRLTAWLRAIPAYIHGDYDHEPLHHTHRTDAEKRERRNAKARKARAAKRDTQ